MHIKIQFLIQYNAAIIQNGALRAILAQLDLGPLGLTWIRLDPNTWFEALNTLAKDRLLVFVTSVSIRQQRLIDQS